MDYMVYKNKNGETKIKKLGPSWNPLANKDADFILKAKTESWGNKKNAK